MYIVEWMDKSLSLSELLIHESFQVGHLDLDRGLSHHLKTPPFLFRDLGLVSDWAHLSRFSVFRARVLHSQRSFWERTISEHKTELHSGPCIEKPDLDTGLFWLHDLKKTTSAIKFLLFTVYLGKQTSNQAITIKNATSE